MVTLPRPVDASVKGSTVDVTENSPTDAAIHSSAENMTDNLVTFRLQVYTV